MFLDKATVRAHMINSKLFLTDLYNCENSAGAKRALNFAKDSELKVLIEVLYHIAAGSIHVEKSHYSIICKSKRMPLLIKGFSKEKKVKDLIGSDRATQLKTLYKFASVYHSLLYYLFNKKEVTQHE